MTEGSEIRSQVSISFALLLLGIGLAFLILPFLGITVKHLLTIAFIIVAIYPATVRRSPYLPAVCAAIAILWLFDFTTPILPYLVTLLLVLFAVREFVRFCNVKTTPAKWWVLAGVAFCVLFAIVSFFPALRRFPGIWLGLTFVGVATAHYMAAIGGRKAVIEE